MKSNIDSLQDISSNGKIDYVVMAQDWDCSNLKTQTSAILSSTFTWKFSKDDELYEGIFFPLTPFGTYQHVRSK